MPHSPPLRLSSLDPGHSTAESPTICLPREIPPPSFDRNEINDHLLPIKISAQNFKTSISLRDTIHNKIQLRSFDTPDLLVVTELDPQVGFNLWQRFETSENIAVNLSFTPTLHTFTIKMPSPLHNCVFPWFIISRDNWIDTGLLSRTEKYQLTAQADTTITLTQGRYASSKKEPDLQVDIKGRHLPTVCFEVGYSESKPFLEEDMRKLLIGGQGHITAVILIKWYRRSHGVGGVVELWRLDMNGNPLKDQDAVVFPKPPAPQPPISVTREQLFGSAILPDRSPHDIFPLSLDELRTAARLEMAKQNLTPL